MTPFSSVLKNQGELARPDLGIKYITSYIRYYLRGKTTNQGAPARRLADATSAGETAPVYVLPKWVRT